jgi:hypothetical protein
VPLDAHPGVLIGTGIVPGADDEASDDRGVAAGDGIGGPFVTGLFAATADGVAFAVATEPSTDGGPRYS